MISPSERIAPAATAGGPSPVLVAASARLREGSTRASGSSSTPPPTRGMAFVVIFHLAPAQESHVAEILQKATRMTVSQVAGNERVEPDHVYVIAPAHVARRSAPACWRPDRPQSRTTAPGPSTRSSPRWPRTSRTRAVGIVLSGTGSDGSRRPAAIHAAGGLCLVQDPDDGRVRRHAAERHRRRCRRLGPSRPKRWGRSSSTTPRIPVAPAAGSRQGRPSSRASGIGHSRAARQPIPRRLPRLQDAAPSSAGPSGAWSSSASPAGRPISSPCETHPGEVDELYRDLLIGVTGFFRDPEEWERLAREVVPALVESAADRRPRCASGSPGCATGEEAYASPSSSSSSSRPRAAASS